MGHVIGDVLPPAIGVAICPVLITAVIAMPANRQSAFVRRGEELVSAMRRTPTEERLCALAHGDLGALELPADARRRDSRLVQIAALVALDGPLVSWVAQLDAADEAQLELEQILGTLVGDRTDRRDAPDRRRRQEDRPRSRARRRAV